MKPLPLLLTGLGVLVALGLFLPSGQSAKKPVASTTASSSTKTATTDSPRVDLSFPDYTKVKPVQNDPVFSALTEFVATYKVWLIDHPTDKEKGEALIEFVRLHNRFANQVATLTGNKALVPRFAYKNLRDNNYPLAMMRVRNYLRDRGWATVFTAPTVIGESGPNERMIGQITMAKVVLRKEESVIDDRGKSRPCISDITETILKNWTQSSTVQAITVDNYVVHFADSLASRAVFIYRRCQAPPSSTKSHRLLQIEWEDQYRSLDPEAFVKTVAQAHHKDVKAHEFQHVGDVQLQAAATSSTIKSIARQQVHCFAELRGQTKAALVSETPLAALSVLYYWAYEQNNLILRHAGQMALDEIGGLRELDLDNSRQILTVQAREGLQKIWNETEVWQPLLLKNLDKEDPFEAVRATLHRQGRKTF